MAYQGGGGPAPLRNGYWPGHDPPNATAYSNGPRPHRPQIPTAGNHSQYQPPTPSSPHVGRGQYWSQNASPQYAQGRSASQPAVNGYHLPIPTPTHAPPPASTRPQPPPPPPNPPQAQQPQPQFISPAQLFQQPAPVQAQSLPQYMSPQQIFQPRNSASIPSARMAPVQNVTIDRPNLLISLAEEFFDAAHELGPSVALSMTKESVEAYEKLIATGLGCLDTALKNVKLPPRLEANIRLRYAGVLYEETENFMEAETALSKGIALCDRNHYYDIKYAMQFLLAQFMFKKNPKAAMKALDGHISDATAYQHYSWVYALRFLRASYSLESGNPTDAHAAIQNLRAIAQLSSQQGDHAIYLAVSLVEAMAHLKSNGPDSMEGAQRAIAAAWTHQFDVGSQIPQLTGLAHILDVVCSIRQGNPKIMLVKLKDMQTMMDGALKDPTWSSTDDTIAIPINRHKNSSQVVSPDTRMIIGIGDDGRDNLMMSFLSKKDTYSITYLLCGMVLMHRNSTDRKAFQYLETGLTSLEENIRTSRTSSGLLPDCVLKTQWRGQILCYFHTYMAFCAAATADWAGMKTCLNKLRATAKNHDVPIVGSLEIIALYLDGVYYQGVGDLDNALHTFQGTRFDLSRFKSSNLSSADQFVRDISLLAALNTLWILQDPGRQDPNANNLLIAELEGLCENHPNKDIQTAFNLVMATVNVNPPAPLFKIKSYLRAALSGAQTTANTQFLCITLNVMCNKFFANVVGDQAEKSALAASVQAKKSGNTLWRSVADGMLAQCYDVNGKKEEASKTFELAQMLAQKALPNS